MTKPKKTALEVMTELTDDESVLFHAILDAVMAWNNQPARKGDVGAGMRLVTCLSGLFGILLKNETLKRDMSISESATFYSHFLTGVTLATKAPFELVGWDVEVLPVKEGE